MALRSSERRWGAVIQLLHWTIAAGIVFMVSWGLWMTDLPKSVHKLHAYAIHKSVGLTILAVVFLRLLWRLTETRPAPAPMPGWQEHAARWVHVLLYGLLFALPLTGWLYNSLAGLPLRWFGLFHVPSLHATDDAVKGTVRDLHEALAWVLVAIASAHGLAALKHHFLDRDHTLAAMLPGLKPRPKT